MSAVRCALLEVMQNLALLAQGVFAEVPCGERACRQAWRSAQESERGASRSSLVSQARV